MRPEIYIQFLFQFFMKEVHKKIANKIKPIFLKPFFFFLILKHGKGKEMNYVFNEKKKINENVFEKKAFLKRRFINEKKNHGYTQFNKKISFEQNEFQILHSTFFMVCLFILFFLCIILDSLRIH
ncbi:hypothetical protein HMI55_003139 [Coelomomyces lativittatus]|nr:hypothetical protein HMI55_003139 [Coelomomyces lativittatus]KAJ1505780.1 hypothetical protein HMI56_000946 [Coelomomyces lativittatus]